MKISKLIDILTRLRDKNGDIDVVGEFDGSDICVGEVLGHKDEPTYVEISIVFGEESERKTE